MFAVLHPPLAINLLAVMWCEELICAYVRSNYKRIKLIQFAHRADLGMSDFCTFLYICYHYIAVLFSFNLYFRGHIMSKLIENYNYNNEKYIEKKFSLNWTKVQVGACSFNFRCSNNLTISGLYDLMLFFFQINFKLYWVTLNIEPIDEAWMTLLLTKRK